ncbi:hybrid sensor histidine kinase/response regulator [Sphingomonas bacterium]|uniref:hybrid sensor histidine kinase/response regulator n=1 Tax=Sphingomonas bacterium TaxID=1895847 RepID=UPI001574FEF0|nr:ATP-binding protein [Sphingomonas bacterium]
MRRRLQRLAELDVVDRWSSWLPSWASQLLLGSVCTALFAIVRTGVDAVAPTAGPYAPVYPLVLIATLFGRWRAGVVAYAGCFAWTWFVVLPRAAARAVPLATDVTRTVVSASTVLVVLVFAEVFRQAVRRAVAEREQAIGALRERERDLQRLNQDLENRVAERAREAGRTWRVSPDLQGFLNADGFFESSNPAWQATLRWSEAEIRTTPFLDLVHPDDGERTRAAWEQVREGRPVLRFENRCRSTDGGWRWLSWAVVPEDGRYYCSARDVTEQKEAAETLATMQEALRQSQKLEAIGQLTGGVAHDFNNLLTVIRGSIDLLKRPGIAEDRRERYIDAIGDTADRAARLTGQLLAFARRQTLVPEVFDSGACLLEVATMLGTLTGSRIEVETRIPDEPCLVSADRSQFETALVNMGINARDAMNGEGRLTIAVDAVSGIPELRGHGPVAGDFVAITLRDTGEGVAPQDHARIFEPFFTTKEQGKGTGLGLSQVIGFAKQSGGDIRVESTIGEGTTFTLYLPRVPQDAGVPPQASVPEPTMDGDGICVLVVEDNEQVGEFATQALRELGYDSVLARDATEALRELAQNPGRHHVVFSDVVMPGMSGLDLAREIRRSHPDMPVILTSGYSHVLAQNGTHGFELLHKPYSVEQLSRVFRKALSRQSSASG